MNATTYDIDKLAAEAAYTTRSLFASYGEAYDACRRQLVREANILAMPVDPIIDQAARAILAKRSIDDMGLTPSQRAVAGFRATMMRHLGIEP